MNVTIKKIAEIAGVSRGTVDRALNNRPGVNPQVRERVRKIADDLGYRPNPAAKVLANSRYNTKKIGILVNSIGNPFFDEVIRGVHGALDKFDEFGLQSSIKLMKGYDDPDRQIALLDELEEEQVNGIVMTPINVPEIADRIHDLKQKNIPVVTINTDVLDSERMAFVGCHYKQSGAIAAGIMGMVGRGQPERYAIIGNSVKNLAVERRIVGVLETLKKDFPWIETVSVLHNDDSDSICYRLVRELTEQNEGLDGICFAGAGAEEGIRAAMECKKKLKIVTFDLTEGIRRYLKEDVITATICQEPYRQGYDGVNILGKFILWGQEPKKIINHTELTVATKYCV